MKSPFLLFFLFTLFSLHAQSDSTNTPQKGNKFIMVGVFGNNTILNYRVYQSPVLAIRLGVDGRYDEYQQITNYSNIESQIDLKDLQANIHVGLQRTLFSASRLETYLGADLSIGFAKSFRHSEFNSFEYDTTIDNYVFSYQREVSDKISYLTPAFRPFIGTNVYVYKGLSLGVEYRIPLFTKFIQLSEAYSVVFKDIAGNIIPAPPGYYPDSNTKNKSTHVGLVGSTSVTVSFRIR